MVKLETTIPDTQLTIGVNLLYQHFNSEILSVTSAFDEGAGRTLEVKSGNYIYKLTDDLRRFFNEYYCPADVYDFENRPNTEKLRFPELKLLSYGPNEGDLLMFATADDYSGVLPVVAPIGHGKTSLIGYTFFYLRPLINQFVESTIPIYFDFNLLRAQIKGFATSSEGFRVSFIELIIRPKLIEVSTQFSRLPDEDFWKWYSENSQNGYLAAITDLHDIYNNDLEKLETEIMLRRREERLTQDFLILSLRYSYEVKKKRIVILLDNLDPYPIETIVFIISIAQELAALGKCKIIYTIRNTTLYRLHILDERISSDTSLKMQPIASSDVLDKRCKALSAELTKKAFNYTFRAAGVEVNIKDFNEPFESFINSIANTSGLLEQFCNGDIRKQLKMMRIILSSGMLSDKIIRESFEHRVLQRIQEYEIIRLIVTNGCSTYAEKTSDDVPGLINLLSFKEAGDTMSVFFNLIICSYFSRFSENGVDFEMARSDFQALVRNHPNYQSHAIDFDKVLTLLINNSIIETPSHYHLDDYRAIRTLEDGHLSPLGYLYLNKLRIEYNYICFVKDSVLFSEMPIYESSASIWHNCMTDSGVLQFTKYHSKIHESLGIFLFEYANAEFLMLEWLVSQHRLNMYNLNFNCSSSNLHSLDMVRACLRSAINLRLSEIHKKAYQDLEEGIKHMAHQRKIPIR